MKNIFLDNETMLILANIRTREITDEEANILQMKLKKVLQKEGDSDEIDGVEDGGEIDYMSQTMIDTYLKSSVRVIVELHKADCIVKRGYYFYNDLIVLLDAYRDGGEFMWLPSVTLLMGSIADMISDQPIESENEEIEGVLSTGCDEENSLEKLLECVTEEKYRRLLQEKPLQNPYLQMKGSSTTEDKKCIIDVFFTNNSAFYFRQEDNKFYYGTANRSTIVNILGNWMLCQHRNMIMNMLHEES